MAKSKKDAAPAESSALAVSGSDDLPIDGITERERRFGEAYFELSVELGKDVGVALPAYRRAFPDALVADAGASTIARNLLASPRVRALVSLLRSQFSQRAMVPAERAIMEIERVAFANILDYIRIDKDGNASIDLRNVTHEQASAIMEVDTTIEEFTDEKGNTTKKSRIKLKLNSKMDALDKLARIHALYQDKMAVRFELGDIDAAIERMERELQMQGVGDVIEAEAVRKPN